ncbi:unnamed protein product [Caenorhabditis angaria]|uniref:Uncharacterized protein n=1 Tax=Caenorhabditis angaria TaxID=860376 RepID=A0A9P1N934_9PELO|nr:unnamed protein product [Caenorhabditis angaria]
MAPKIQDVKWIVDMIRNTNYQLLSMVMVVPFGEHFASKEQHIMRHRNEKILKSTALFCCEDETICRNYLFQQENDPKPCKENVQKWFARRFLNSSANHPISILLNIYGKY